MSTKRDHKRIEQASEENADFEKESKSNGDAEEEQEEDQSPKTSHAEKDFQEAWVGLIQHNGTAKLPKKPWVETHCMKLKGKKKCIFVRNGGHSIPTVMMCGTNIPHKQKIRDVVDSICRTPNCIIPDHHRWMPKQEKLTRQSCGASVMCPTCHLEIPFPCSHDPACQWSVSSIGGCTGCQQGGSQLKAEQETAATFESIQPTRKSTTTVVSHSQPTQRHKKLKKEKNRMHTPSQLADKNFHKSWVRVIQDHGTTKLPKKPWMKTCCSKLNSNLKNVGVHGGGRGGSYPLPTVMMRGTNMPSKDKPFDTVDSICRTRDCIIPNHHRWMPKEEKWSRQSCGSGLMCPTCHVEIPLPCSHYPPCEWRIVSKENCSACKSHE